MHVPHPHLEGWVGFTSLVRPGCCIPLNYKNNTYTSLVASDHGRILNLGVAGKASLGGLALEISMLFTL